jgi:hypothetical protein
MAGAAGWWMAALGLCWTAFMVCHRLHCNAWLMVGDYVSLMDVTIRRPLGSNV